MIRMLVLQYSRGFMPAHIVWDKAYMHFWIKYGDDSVAVSLADRVKRVVTGG